MDERVLDFAEKHRITVVTTLLPNGKPHSATMHYAVDKDPVYFISLTERNSRKCSHFTPGEKYPASMVWF